MTFHWKLEDRLRWTATRALYEKGLVAGWLVLCIGVALILILSR